MSGCCEAVLLLLLLLLLLQLQLLLLLPWPWLLPWFGLLQLAFALAPLPLAGEGLG